MDMDANRLLAQVVSAYASMSSYADEGVVLQPIVIPELSTVVKSQFSTAILKPDLFRFKFSRPHPYPPLSHIVTTSVYGFDGTVAYSWVKFPGKASELRIERNLQMVVAAATGVSTRSVRTIAELMFPAIGGSLISALKSAVVAEDEDFEGARCHVIRGQDPVGNDVAYWIDHTTLTLRKTVRGGPYPSEEIRRNIQVNEPIDVRIFESPKSEV